MSQTHAGSGRHQGTDVALTPQIRRKILRRLCLLPPIMAGIALSSAICGAAFILATRMQENMGTKALCLAFLAFPAWLTGYAALACWRNTRGSLRALIRGRATQHTGMLDHAGLALEKGRTCLRYSIDGQHVDVDFDDQGCVFWSRPSIAFFTSEHAGQRVKLTRAGRDLYAMEYLDLTPPRCEEHPMEQRDWNEIRSQLVLLMQTAGIALAATLVVIAVAVAPMGERSFVIGGWVLAAVALILAAALLLLARTGIALSCWRRHLVRKLVTSGRPEEILLKRGRENGRSYRTLHVRLGGRWHWLPGEPDWLHKDGAHPAIIGDVTIEYAIRDSLSERIRYQWHCIDRATPAAADPPDDASTDRIDETAKSSAGRLPKRRRRKQRISR